MATPTTNEPSFIKVLIILLIMGLVLSGAVLANFTDVKMKSLQKTNQKLFAKEELTINDFQIGGIQLTDPVSKLLEKYGKPSKITSDKANEMIIYNYDKFSVELGVRTKKVLNIIIKKPGMLTYRGIGINSDEKDVIKHYGNTEKYENMYLIYSKVVQENDFDCEYTLDLKLINRRVKEIKIYFAAD